MSARHLVLNLRDARPIWAIPPWAEAEILAALPRDWTTTVIESPVDGRGDGGAPTAEVVEAVGSAEIYLGFGFPRALFDAAQRQRSPLRWIHSAAAGVGGSLYPEMLEAEVRLTNSAGVHAEPMADTVLGMMLHFARGFDFAVAAQRESRWDKAPFEAAESPVRELAGSTVGVVGFGGIGRAVARRATALGMQVLALKRRPGEAPPSVRLLFGTEGLDELLERSDFVVVTIPETDSTRSLLGPERLDRMKRGAVLINVARGGIVDEDALAERLRAGRLRGAGLDVVQREPLPGESPLWALPNVLITPHVSATSRGFWRRETDLIVQNLHRYLEGRPLVNLVDKRAGY